MWYYIIAGIFYLLVMLLTFCDNTRKSAWFIPICVSLNTLGTIIWFLLVKNLDDKKKILVNSVYWDFMILVIGYCLPLILFKFEFSLIQFLGLILIIFGFALIKVVHIF